MIILLGRLRITYIFILMQIIKKQKRNILKMKLNDI